MPAVQRVKSTRKGAAAAAASPTEVVSPLRHSLHTNMRSEMSSGRKSPSDRNILKVVLGDLLFDTWYGSFYPDELVGGGKHEVDRLYVCRWCFKYSRELMPYMAHVRVCPARTEPPPGQMIYEKDSYSIYEVNGEDHQLFCQNLSLFAKLFLENKSVCFDLTTFNYYLLVYTYPTTTSPAVGPTRQVVGFFSKEKMSWDNNNLACILVFPPWQRKGLGKILMGVSYELSRREGRIGGPEKPRTTTTVKDISEETYILQDDVMAALKEMNVLNAKKRADGSAIINQGAVRDWARSTGADLGPVVEMDGFVDELLPVPEDEASSV
ncbi:MAG: hypothetical protein M1838_004010 [Thelocarpon superellum]|nr:MAG: hypothetical protein M1838_004010 [Thelocarpon superellum]